MPHENSISTGTPQDWLRHARSDLALASISRPDDVLWEGLCFHAQQTIEKSLKAVLIACNVPFPKTHNIRALIDLLPADLPSLETIQDSASLTEYAVTTRYPSVLEPVDEEEYQEAVQLAKVVLSWAEQVIQHQDESE
jgi:HEPN domain-containing protein